MTLTILFLEINSSVSFLPVWAQIVLLIFAALCLFFQWRHSIAISEFGVVKQTVTRLREENKVLIHDNAELLARTNLQPLLEAFNAWQVEARENFQRAMIRLEEIRAENITGVNAAQSVLIGIADSLRDIKHNQAEA